MLKTFKKIYIFHSLYDILHLLEVGVATTNLSKMKLNKYSRIKLHDIHTRHGG